MHLPHPESFIRLILLGFSLVALPLLIALAYAAIYVDQLSNQSRHAVYQAVRSTQSSRKLTEEITMMERTARQFQVLGDSLLFNSYRETRTKFKETQEELFKLPLENSIRNTLNLITEQEDEIFTTLHDNEYNSEQSKEAVGKFVTLSALARDILKGSNLVINREIEEMREIADKAQSFFMILGLASIPISVLVAAAFSFLIARPIRQIEQAILQIGRGKFGPAIEVSGPQDLQFLGDRLNWLRLRLAEVEAEKVKFLRHVSHELKTPLSSIKEGSELLADEVVGSLTTDQKEVVDILHANTEQLKKLIENLLKFSVSQVKQAVLKNDRVNLKTLIQEVLADQKLSIKAKKLQIQVSLEPLSIQCDREKTKIILDNLLSNAVKYSYPKGAIQVNISAHKKEILIDINDNGPGIDEKDRERIFEPFYQGKILAKGHIKGSGLGLAIVREYVEEHNWHIEIIDKNETGAHFCIHIPTMLREESA